MKLTEIKELMAYTVKLGITRLAVEDLEIENAQALQQIPKFKTPEQEDEELLYHSGVA